MNATGRLGDLKEAIRGLRDQELWQCTDADLNSALTVLGIAYHHVGVLLGRVGLEANRRNTLGDLGYADAAGLLANTTPLTAAQAHRIVRGGKRIETIGGYHEDYEPIRDAHDRGELPTPHAEMIESFLARYNNRIPREAREAVVTTLLAFGADPDSKQLKNAITTLRESLDSDEESPNPSEDRDLDSLKFSPLLNGRYHLDVDMNKLCAEMLMELLNALQAPQTGDENTTRRRTPPQLRFDAFEEMLRRALATAHLPVEAGTRPNVNLLADLHSLFADTPDSDIFTPRHSDDPIQQQPSAENHPHPPEHRSEPFVSPVRNDAGSPNTDACAAEGSRLAGDCFDDEGDADASGIRCADDAGASDGGARDMAGGSSDEPGDVFGVRRVRNQFRAVGDSGVEATGRSMIDGIRRQIARTATLAWGGAISRDLARMIACDATLRTILTENGKPLDMGRATRYVTPGLRRYLVLRDGGCAFPGCRRPPNWCDAHHIVWWSNNGGTDHRNLVLLCRHHHTVVHQHGWDIQMGEHEIPWFVPPVHYDLFRRPIPANGRAPVPCAA